ncbi:MAG TPA: LysR family transcriptional regulator [Thermoleophilaceae bacterium]
MRPDVRQLQYFIAVAEELNFTRAAERLNLVQQSLSTAIAQLEALLGIKLFERTTRSVTLTNAGAAWLPYARDALAAAERAAAAARDLAAGRAGQLRVGLAATAALDVTPRLLRTFAERFPLVELAIEHFDCQDPSGGLRERRSDVAIVRPPFNDDGLELLVIATEPRFAVLAADHPLADRAALDFAELADEPWMDIATDPIWWDFWRVAELRSGPPKVGAICRSCEELLEAARAGTATGLVGESVVRAQSWSQLAFVEVRDIAPSTVAVAWHSDNHQLAVRNFVDLAIDLSTPSPSSSGPSAQPAAM